MVDEVLAAVARRKEEGKALPDFISVDSGEGGSATAPLEMMESVGLTTNNALYIIDTTLQKYGLRDDIKVIASGKLLTPDDIIITMSMGADAVGIDLKAVQFLCFDRLIERFLVFDHPFKGGRIA